MRYLVPIITIIILSGCGNKKSKQKDYLTEKIKLNLTDTTQRYVEDIADSSYIVNLAGAEKTSLKLITNLFITDSLLIVADCTHPSVFIYSRAGKLLDSIVSSVKREDFKTGRFNSITDVFYNEKEKLIEVLDRTSSSIYRFNTHAKIKDTLKLNDTKAFGYWFTRNNNTYYTILNNGNEDRKGFGKYKLDGKTLWYDGEVLSTPVYLRYINIPPQHQLDVFGDSVYCVQSFEDKIFNITGDGSAPVYEFDCPAKNKVSKDLKSSEPSRGFGGYEKTMEQAKVIYEINSLFITDKWVTFKFAFGPRWPPRFVFFNKKSKKVLQYSALKTKAVKEPTLYANIIAKHQDYFVKVISAPQTLKAGNGKAVKKGEFKLLFFKPKDI